MLGTILTSILVIFAAQVVALIVPPILGKAILATIGALEAIFSKR